MAKAVTIPVGGAKRDLHREQRWRRIIREHERSGFGVREFCRRGRLTETAFYYWRRELLRRRQEQEQHGPSSREPQAAFVAVRVADEPVAVTAAPIEIELPGGCRLRVAPPVDRQALADVLLAVSDVERAVLRADALTAQGGGDGEAEPC